MRNTSIASLAALTLVVAACQDGSQPLAPEGPGVELVTAAAAPAGLGTCRPAALRESQKGRITPGSCRYSETLGRRSAYFHTAPAPAGSMLTLSLTPDLAAVFGVKEATPDPLQGTVWGSRTVGAGATSSLSLIGGQASYQVFVSNRDSAQTGAFLLEARAEPVTYACNRLIVLDAPARFGQELDADRACHVTIQYSPYPEAIGQALLAQYHYARLLAGNSYEVRVEGLSGDFPAGLTVFVSTPSGYQVAAQSVGPVPPGGVRTLTITPAVTAYYALEVSSGTPDGQGGWVTPAGSYTLSLTQP